MPSARHWSLITLRPITGVCIQGCSAVTGGNLLIGIHWLLDDMSSRIFTAD
ncbi:unnamed protein product [Staurois parvus]|uniref:Uncharacterized protein n=1 Tax=Staurois parvus TaxID=386267 RepID=A0ABN9D2D1_9NEOB|nr:unnamed protein product [Staurois parvus]